MHLAILMTNTDESDFAQAHPKDGEKFTKLIHLVRPEWQTTSYSVKDGVFPDDLGRFDGVMITGSPASVHDKDPWVAQLLALIKEIYETQKPMFGACYGHQAIALALEGRVENNPSGWVFGLTHSEVVHDVAWMRDLPRQFAQYGAHVEAVSKLPEGADIISVSESCEITGFRIGNKVYTTQNHPEMNYDFIAALISEYEAKLPPGVGENARMSLTQDADNYAYAETIARFFEHALAD